MFYSPLHILSQKSLYLNPVKYGNMKEQPTPNMLVVFFRCKHIFNKNTLNIMKMYTAAQRCQ